MSNNGTPSNSDILAALSAAESASMDNAGSRSSAPAALRQRSHDSHAARGSPASTQASPNPGATGSHESIMRSPGLGQPFIPSPLQPPRAQFSSGESPSSSEPKSAPPAIVHFDPEAADSDEDDEDFDDNGSPRKKRKTTGAQRKDDGANQPEKPRRKIDIAYIEKKEKRHISFSKRKAGIMKKAYELATLTGTEVLLLVVSETGIVFTFTTAKFQPMVALGKDGKPSEGQRLIQACLASDPENGKEFVPPFTGRDDGHLYPLPNAAMSKPFEVHSNVHGGQIALRTRPPRSRKATSSPSGGRRGPPSAPPSPTKMTHDGMASPGPQIIVNDMPGTPGRHPQYIRRHPDEYPGSAPGSNQAPPVSPSQVPRQPPPPIPSARSYADMIDRSGPGGMYGPGSMYQHERRISNEYGSYYRQPIEPSMYDQGDLYYEPGHYVLRNDSSMRHSGEYQYDSMSLPRSIPPSYGGPPPGPLAYPSQQQQPQQQSHQAQHQQPQQQHQQQQAQQQQQQQPPYAIPAPPGQYHSGMPPHMTSSQRMTQGGKGGPGHMQPMGGNSSHNSSHNSSLYDPSSSEGFVAISPRDQA